jgi:hypothetical protein
MVYRLPRSMRVSLFGACAVLVVISLLPPLMPSTRTITDAWIKYALLLLMTIPAAIWCYREASSSRVELSSSGLKVYSVLYQVTSTWSNVERLDMSPFGGQILHLREPGLKSVFPLTLWFRLSGYDRRIQLAPFVTDRRTSELLRDIQIFAPHAVRKEK